MSDRDPPNGPVFDSQGARREQAIARFEDAWTRDERPSIDSHLVGEGAERRAILVELVHIDLERRLEKGEPARAEEYLARYPEMTLSADEAVELICAEHALRKRREPGLAAQEYLARFPEYCEKLAERLKGPQTPAIDETVLVPPAGGPDQPRALHVRCPHCRNAIEIVDDTPLAQITCTSCGSKFSLVGDEALAPQTTGGALRRQRFGHFELIEQLGSGACGAVWKACDTQLDRIVAIKIPRKGQLDRDETEMFLREARAAAQLQHPGIVAVHEVGREGDVVYIVSDFVEGLPLDKWLAEQRPTPRHAAELVIKIAEALHHAHEKGVIHRDLKPGNIMIDAAGEPHVMDFGLAKREAGEITMTVDGQIMGTPAYMSPEQARGEAHRVDRRTDIYSLGAILFELLTGERPFRGNVRMLLKQVIEDEPPSPRRLDSRIPRDLETICLKCLEKDPRRRYATAQELAEELSRYLDGLPIHARPIGWAARAWRWSKRNPVVASLLVIVGLLFMVSVFAALGESRQRRIAQQQAETFRRHNYNSQMARAWPLVHESPTDAWAILGNSDQCPWPLLDFSWRLLDELNEGRKPAECLHAGAAREIAFSGDGDAVALVVGDHCLFWDLPASTSEKFPLCYVEDRPSASHAFVAISADRKQLLLPVVPHFTYPTVHGLENPRVATYRLESHEWSRITHWKVKGKPARNGDYEVEPHEGESVVAARFSDDGRLLATASETEVRVWRMPKSGTIEPFVEQDRILVSRNGKRNILDVRFAPSGRTIAVSVAGPHLMLFGLFEEGQVVQERFVEMPGRLIDIAADSKYALVELQPGLLELRVVETGATIATLKQAPNAILAVGFRRGETCPLIVGNDGALRIWNPQTQQVSDSVRLADWPTKVRTVRLAPACDRILAEDCAGTVRVWESATGKITTQRTIASNVAVAFTPDSAFLATAGADGQLRYWDLTPIEDDAQIGSTAALTIPATHASSLAFSADRGVGVGATADGRLVLCDPPTVDKPMPAFRWHASPTSARRVTGISFRQRGSVVELFHAEGRTDTFGLDSQGQQEHPSLAAAEGDSGRCAPVQTPDGRTSAAVVRNPGSLERCENIRLSDVANGWPTQVLSGHRDRIFFLAFTPDGRTLVSASRDDTIRFWDPVTGDLRLLLTAQALRAKNWSVAAHQEAVAPAHARAARDAASFYSVALSRNGRFLAVGYDDGVAQVWVAKPPCFRGRVVLPNTAVCQATFTSDGGLLTSIEDSRLDVSLVLRDALTLREVQRMPWSTSAPAANRVLAPCASFAVVNKSRDALQFWDPQRGKLVAERPHFADSGIGPAPHVFSPDGRAIAVKTDTNKTCVVYDHSGNELGRVQVAQIDPERDCEFAKIAIGPFGERCVLQISRVTRSTNRSESTVHRPLYLWEVGSGTVTCHVPRPGENFSPVAFVNGGKWIAIATMLNRIRFYDFTSRTLEPGQIDLFKPEIPGTSITRHFGPPTVATSGDGSRLAFFHEATKAIQVWDVLSQTPILSVPVEAAHVFLRDAADGRGRRSVWGGMSLSHDGSELVLWGGPNVPSFSIVPSGAHVCVYDLSTSGLGADDTWFGQYQGFVARSRAQRWANHGSQSGQSEAQAAPSIEQRPAAKLADICGKYLFSLADGRVLVAGWPKRKAHQPTDGQLMLLHFDPDGPSSLLPIGANLSIDAAAICERVAPGEPTTVFLVTSDGRLKSADLARPTELRVLATFPDNRQIGSLAVSSDRRWVAAAGSDQALDVFDAGTGQKLKTLKQPSFSAGLAFRPDGKRLAVAGTGELEVWETSGWTLRAKITTHSWCDKVAYAPDGKLLATGECCSDAKIDLWDGENHVHRRTCRGHRGAVSSLAFHPSGRLLASASSDGTIRLWDPRSGQETAVFTGHSGGVCTVTFTTDGNHLVSSGVDDTVLLWKIPDAITDSIRKR